MNPITLKLLDNQLDIRYRNEHLDESIKKFRYIIGFMVLGIVML